MKFPVLAAALLLIFTSFGRGAENDAQNIDAVLAGVDRSGLMRQLQEREQKIEQLSEEEKTALNEARKKALEDPAVKAVLAARNEAAQELDATLRANMLKADPTLASVFEKMATPPAPH
ncbi:MAG: hypothetical protein ABI946_02205 [Chthoniobacterales bacterium]